VRLRGRSRSRQRRVTGSREHKAQPWLLQHAVDAGLCAGPTFVVLRSDNTCAVSATSKLWSRADGIDAVTADLRAILRERPDLHVASVHVPGVQNGLADYLSRLPEPAFAARVLTCEAWHFAMQ